MFPGRLRSAWNALVTAALAPGILSHEYAHVLACRLCSIDVHATPALNPFGDDAYVDHAPVDSFRADFAIALAPLVGNSVLGIGAFALAASALAPPWNLAGVWLGACFALTAFPSPSDTADLVGHARSLPPRTRPVGYALAVPVRALTRTPFVAGMLGYLWILVLYGLVGGTSF
ncbi:hypothetical protein ACFOZ7_10370 [Natribaculum luteum]|uniref:DUF3267 domain-containing protein n=1 Tax=Natribaculum luteum TaxID=1586232 RepID=A0ABD5P038_9EURY|nr:hypothetical protein [Natribaculum luteum]